MAFTCPQSIRACAARITRLNSCGVALDPMTPNSRIQFAAFTEVGMAPDTEDGADITVKNACGQICIRNKDCRRLKGFDVTMVLCGVPTPALEMLLDAALLADPNNVGDFRGMVLRESKGASCADPKSLELWSVNANRAQCGVGGAGAAAYMQHLLPLTSNWEIDQDLTFTYEDPLTIGLSGYAENNPNWFPAYPGEDFPAYVPGGGDPDGTPTGVVGDAVIPPGVDADPWTSEDQDAIQAGGPWAYITVAELPAVEDCNYFGVFTS